ncbi:hypothetical protein GGR56DRAFT_629488 [Xylariaceae sp. FL0804]|nr:hypothetical protein GGR56DRAFT_629488 [Xylariaceae sp. FL0804]
MCVCVCVSVADLAHTLSCTSLALLLLLDFNGKWKSVGRKGATYPLGVKGNRIGGRTGRESTIFTTCEGDLL